MSAWSRRSVSGRLENLARKARRRGDEKQAVLWYRALNLHHQAEQHHHLAAERRWRFNNDRKEWERMEEELRTLRMYQITHPDLPNAGAAPAP